MVGPTGLEPIMTEPKPVVLPLHHGPILSNFGAKVVVFCSTTKFFSIFFLFYGEKIVILLSALHQKVFSVNQIL